MLRTKYVDVEWEKLGTCPVRQKAQLECRGVSTKTMPSGSVSNFANTEKFASQPLSEQKLDDGQRGP